VYIEGKPYGSDCASYVGSLIRDREERHQDAAERLQRGSALHPGDLIRVVAIPGYIGSASQETRQLFENALGKIFKIQGIGRFGHLELYVCDKDVLWIDPAHVELVKESPP
jgi:hypothetical protein